MTKPRLKYLAGAAVLLILSTQIASAGPDGTCEEYNNQETAASEVPSSPVLTAATDYTQIAQIAPAAGDTAAVTASAKTDAVEMAPPAR